ncbi:MAG: DUF4234 domain-containing protein [Ruminococcus sp.]|jgi:hypothetical protein|nr:DUF4234 domain-containing protein [Ruminococcus sp.]
MVKERNIAVCVILTIITCGIYGLVWIASINDEARNVSGTTKGFSGGLVILLSIVTCGLFMIYWGYIMGGIMKTAGDNSGVQIEDRSVIYLILAIFELSIVNYCLIQNDLNMIANSKSGVVQ